MINLTSWGIPLKIHEGSIWAGVELIMLGHNTKRRQTDWVYCENNQDILTEPACILQDFYRVQKSFREISRFVNLLIISMSDEKIGSKSNRVSPVDCSVL